MTTISSGEDYVISAGQRDVGDVVLGGGTLCDDGGADTNTMIDGGGHALVMEGGAADDAIVETGGEQCVELAATASGATVYANGTQEVFDGGVATATNLNGGAQNVYSAGTADNVTISNAGFEFVQGAGSTAKGVTISGGSQYVFSGGVAYDTNVTDGSAYVSAGGSAVSATFNSGGDDTVGSGGFAIDTTLIGGYEYVVSGGIISGTTISSGGQLELADGAVTSGGEIEFEGKAFKGYDNVLAGSLTIDSHTLPTATISGFSLGDPIDLTQISCKPAISCSETNGGVVLTGVGTLNLSVTDALNDSIDTIPVIGLKPDGSGGTDVETAPLMALLALAMDTYSYTSGPPAVGIYGPDSYQIIASMEDKGFEAIAYELNLGSGDPSVVVAFRGTQTGAGFPTAIKNLLADASFPQGKPNAILKLYASDAATFLKSVVQSTQSLHPLITLTGHSLGGALAQLVGKASNFATAAFDAPGAGQLYGQLTNQLAPALGLGYGGTNVNYAISGDQVSFAGTPIGQPYTISSPYGTNANSSLSDVVNNVMNNHGVGPSGWQTAFSNIQSSVTPGLTGLDIAGIAQAALQSSSATKLNFALNELADKVVAFDPVSGTGFTFTADPGSPNFSSIELPFEPGVAEYEFSYETGSTWSAQQVLQPGVALTLPSGVDGVQFDPVDGSGQPVAMGDGFALTATFATSGTFDGTLSVSGALPVAQPVTAPTILSVAENVAPTAVGISLPTDAAFPDADDNLEAMVTGLPTNGTVYLSDGTTPVTNGEVLTLAQLTTLTFEPTLGASSQNSILTYEVTDPDLSSSTGFAFVTASSNKVVAATVSGQPYFAYEQIFANGVFEGTDYFFASAAGQPYAAEETDYNASGTLDNQIEFEANGAIYFETTSVAHFLDDQIQLDALPGGYGVIDSADDVVRSLGSLAADPDLRSITLTDSGTAVLNLTATQATGDAPAIGKITNSLFEVSTSASNSYYANGANIPLSASTASVYLRASSGLSLTGGSDWVDCLGSGDAVSLSGTNSNWDYVTATGATITLDGAQTDVSGGGNTIAYASGSGDAADLYNTAGSADTVTATGSAVYLNSAQAKVTGGGDWVDFQSGSGNAVTLAGTNNSWDWVTATGATVDFDGAQATIAGGGNTIAFTGGSGNSVAITGAGGSADAITASSSNIYMLGAKATVTGGGDWVDFQSGTDSVTLANTGGSWDWVTAAGATVDFNGAQATVAGGGDTIAFIGGSGNSVALTGTGGSADSLTASNSAIYLLGAQANVSGGGDWIDFQSGSDTAAVSGTGGNGDWVTGTGGTVNLNGAQSVVQGGGDALTLTGTGDAATLIGTGGSADSVNGSNSLLYLNGSQATVTGNSDTLVLTAAPRRPPRAIRMGSCSRPRLANSSPLQIHPTRSSWRFRTSPARCAGR